MQERYLCSTPTFFLGPVVTPTHFFNLEPPLPLTAPSTSLGRSSVWTEWVSNPKYQLNGPLSRSHRLIVFATSWTRNLFSTWKNFRDYPTWRSTVWWFQSLPHRPRSRARSWLHYSFHTSTTKTQKTRPGFTATAGFYDWASVYDERASPTDRCTAHNQMRREQQQSNRTRSETSWAEM